MRVILDFKSKCQHADIRCRACGWHVIVPLDSVNRMFPSLLDFKQA